MLSPVVHIEFPLNLLGGILQKVGATMMPVGKSLIRNMETEISIYDIICLFIRTKKIRETGSATYNFDVVNVAVCIGLIYEEFKEGILLNPFNLLR